MTSHTKSLKDTHNIRVSTWNDNNHVKEATPEVLTKILTTRPDCAEIPYFNFTFNAFDIALPDLSGSEISKQENMEHYKKQCETSMILPYSKLIRHQIEDEPFHTVHSTIYDNGVSLEAQLHQYMHHQIYLESFSKHSNGLHHLLLDELPIILSEGYAIVNSEFIVYGEKLAYRI